MMKLSRTRIKTEFLPFSSLRLILPGFPCNGNSWHAPGAIWSFDRMTDSLASYSSNAILCLSSLHTKDTSGFSPFLSFPPIILNSHNKKFERAAKFRHAQTPIVLALAFVARSNENERPKTFQPFGWTKLLPLRVEAQICDGPHEVLWCPMRCRTLHS